MKYKLINNKTNEEHLCDKVTIDGFDYYVSTEIINSSNYEDFSFWFYNPYIKELQINCNPNSCHKVIATNNPNIDIPKVVNEVEILAEKRYGIERNEVPDWKEWVSNDDFYKIKGFIEGYNKSQETHPFSEEHIREAIKFGKEIQKGQHGNVLIEDFIQDLKQIKTLYYENKDI